MSSQQYFDEVANQWDSMREQFFPDEVREIALSTAQVTPGDRAADVGAGSGFITEALIAACAQVIAVDQSQEMLNVIERKFADAPVEVRQGSADALPLRDGEVKQAFANMYLHHVEEPADAIREMARILQPGGQLVITDLDEHNFTFLKDEHHDRWMGFKREDVHRWFEAAGLRDVSVRGIGSDCCANSECGTEHASVSIFIASGVKG